MDRLFLDANVLFSAAHSETSSLSRLWARAGVELLTSIYAFEEARRNLETPERIARLARLAAQMLVVAIDDSEIALPPKLVLREKDRPILRAAVAAKASHLLTGDLRDFGPFFGKTVLGVLVLRPADYLRHPRKNAGSA